MRIKCDDGYINLDEETHPTVIESVKHDPDNVFERKEGAPVSGGSVGSSVYYAFQGTVEECHEYLGLDPAPVKDRPDPKPKPTVESFSTRDLIVQNRKTLRRIEAKVNWMVDSIKKYN